MVSNVLILAALTWFAPVCAQPQSSPPLPPIDPGLHDIPPLVNFENRQLYAEWRPIAVILYNAAGQFREAHQRLERRLDAIPPRRFLHGRLRSNDREQCDLFREHREIDRQLALYDDNTSYLLSLAMRYLDNTSDADRHRLGSEISHVLRTRTYLQMEAYLIGRRLGVRSGAPCPNSS
jgi:hypothetical protein